MINGENYLIKKLVLKISYESVTEMDIIDTLRSVRNDFAAKGYKFQQGVVKKEDDSQDYKEDYTCERITEFVLQKNNLNIKLNMYDLTLEHVINKDYMGFDTYKKEILSILQQLFVFNKVCKVIRISYSALDSLIFKDINNINHYFDDKFFNYVSLTSKLKLKDNKFNGGKNYFSANISENIKLKLSTVLLKGEMYESDSETIPVYQAIVDSKLICSMEEGESMIQEIDSIFDKLHTNANDIYKGILKEDFLEKLEAGNFDDDIRI